LPKNLQEQLAAAAAAAAATALKNKPVGKAPGSKYA